MKVHKITFDDLHKPGSIWAAVSAVKHEHKSVMRYKRANDWSLEDYCRKNRDSMMYAIRLMAYGMPSRR